MSGWSDPQKGGRAVGAALYPTLSSLLSTAPQPGMRATASDAPGSMLYEVGGKWGGDPGAFTSTTDPNYIAYMSAIAAQTVAPSAVILIGSTPATAVAMEWDSLERKYDVVGKYRRNINLLKLATTVSGFIDENTGYIVSSSVYFTSDFIPVVPAVYSFSTKARFVAFYDQAHVIIPAIVNSELSQRINLPANCAFIRVSFREANRTTAAVYRGDSASEISGAGNSADACLIGGCADSLGATGWQSLVIGATGCTLNIDTQGGTLISGAVGSTTAMCNDTRALAPSIYSRALILMGGTNDWAQSVPLGTKESFEQTTFYGALNVFLKKWTDKYIYSRIFVCTLNYGNMPARVPATWADPEVNTQGLRTMDYAEAMRDRAAYWGCSVIDCARDAGINNGNKATYITNDGNYLHHNAKGIRRIAPLIINAINGILE